MNKRLVSKNRWLSLVMMPILLSSFATLSQNAFADTIIAKTTIGAGEPSLNAVNPNTNMIYVAVQSTPYANTLPSYWIYVINGSTNRVISQIQFASLPTGISSNPTTNRIYVADGQSVSVIDGNTNSITAAISVSGATGIAVNPNTNMIYVSTPSNNAVVVVNGTTGTVAGNIPVGANPRGISINPNTNKVYVANVGTCTPISPVECQWQNYSVSVINGFTNNIVDTIQLQGILITVNPDTNKIYATNGRSLSVIDGVTDTYKTIPEEATCVGVNPNTNKVYACKANGSLDIINGTNNSVSCSLTGFVGPVAVAANQNTNRIYASDYWGQAVYVVDDSTDTCNSPTVPSAPQNLTATGGNFKVTLSWSAPSSNQAYQTTSYNIYRSTSSGTETYIGWTGNTTVYTDTSVTNGQTYFYKIAAVNSLGESPQSSEASTTPAGSPQPPTGLTATATSSSQINLSWTSPANNGGSTITGYEVQRSTDGGSTWTEIVKNTGSTATAYSDTELQPHTTYTYQVSAINSVGTSAGSNTASATTPILTVGGTNIGPFNTSPIP